MRILALASLLPLIAASPMSQPRAVETDRDQVSIDQLELRLPNNNPLIDTVNKREHTRKNRQGRRVKIRKRASRGNPQACLVRNVTTTLTASTAPQSTAFTSTVNVSTAGYTSSSESTVSSRSTNLTVETSTTSKSASSAAQSTAFSVPTTAASTTPSESSASSTLTSTAVHLSSSFAKPSASTTSVHTSTSSEARPSTAIAKSSNSLPVTSSHLATSAVPSSASHILPLTSASDTSLSIVDPTSASTSDSASTSSSAHLSVSTSTSESVPTTVESETSSYSSAAASRAASTSSTSTSTSTRTASTSGTSTSTSSAASATTTLYTVDPDGNGPFTGDGTYFDVGLGACGWYNEPGDPIVAVSQDLFDSWPGYDGSNSNDNPICGLHLDITWGGKTLTVEVADSCPGCAYRSLDLSKGAFEYFADLDVGLLGGTDYTDHITWSWTSGSGSLPALSYTD